MARISSANFYSDDMPLKQAQKEAKKLSLLNPKITFFVIEGLKTICWYYNGMEMFY